MATRLSQNDKALAVVRAMGGRFYEFCQNNSGGQFTINEQRGIAESVFVEARDALEANTRALEIGIYFDPSVDCECCGARWESVRGDDWTYAYADCTSADRRSAYRRNKAIHFLDGSFEWISD